MQFSGLNASRLSVQCPGSAKHNHNDKCFAESGDSCRGRLTVEYDGKPNNEQLQQIEKLANDKIRENVTVEMMSMDRKEAEQKFGSVIYDKYPVPLHIQNLSITVIKDWNINCCLGPHLATTGELGELKILKHRSRPSRNELEISFEVVQPTAKTI